MACGLPLLLGPMVPVASAAAPVSISAPAPVSISAPAPVSIPPVTWLILEKDSTVPGQLDGPHTVTLTCGPTGGTHPDAGGACEYYDGYPYLRPVALPSNGPCPNLIVLRARGMWRGVEISTEYRYMCVMPELTPPWKF
jgi:hypothetical protein